MDTALRLSSLKHDFLGVASHFQGLPRPVAVLHKGRGKWRRKFAHGQRSEENIRRFCLSMHGLAALCDLPPHQLLALVPRLASCS